MRSLWFLPLLFLCPSQLPSLDFYVEAGFHMENLNLDLHKKPDQLHDNFDTVKWNQIIAPEVRAGAAFEFLNCFSVEADGGLLLSTPASNKFSARYREDIGSRSFACHAHKNGDISGNDFSIAVGYALATTSCFRLTALLGYAEQRRKLHSHPGKMKTHINAETDPQRVDITKMHYSARWLGPWAGLRFGCDPCDSLHLILDAEYHHTLLKAKGKWLIQELLSDGYSFNSHICSKQSGVAPGFKVNAAIVHELCAQWKLVLHGYYAWLCKRNGRDTTTHTQCVAKENQVISEGNFRTTPHYRVQWHAWAILGGIDYEF